MTWYNLLVFIFTVQVVCGKLHQPTITTPLGTIEGGIALTVNLNPFYKFEGIPYAKPPVGNLRFEEAQDPEPWKGTWKANTLTRCMQYDHFSKDDEGNYLVHGDEDCLYVNVYTHSLGEKANMDVLVVIHGGAFMFGRGASYGPEIVMDRKVVFVNFNYRLGPLGFLSTEDEVLPGNVGLKDQIKALKWVKENIKYFGGNPDSITIFGLSAGGASVHFHYFAPQSKGLFKGGFSQSGCMLNAWVLAEHVGDKTKKVAALVGCPTGSSEELLDCLKAKPARQVVQTVKEFQPSLYNPFSPFGAVVDGAWSKNPSLPDHPYKLLKQGKVQDLPWIVSYTTAEGLYPAADFYADDQYLFDIDRRWNELMPLILHYNESVVPEQHDEVSQAIREHYLGTQPVNKDTFGTLVQILSDRLFIADIEKAAKLQSSVLKSDVYSYNFNYRGSRSFSEVTSGTKKDLGVCHGDDTIYIVKEKSINTLQTEADKQISELLVNMLISVMQNGLPKTIPSWQPLSKNTQDPYKVLQINKSDDFEMISSRTIGSSEFWNSLPFRENEKLYNEKDEL